MQTYVITPDDASAVVSSLSGNAALPSSGIFYNEGTLFVPDQYTAAVATAVANLPAARKAALSAYAARVRYTFEIAGFTVNGHLYDTDRESQSKLTSAVLLAQVSPTTVFQWKTADGFVQLAASDMVAVASAIGAYVQGVFTKEATADAAVTAGTITTTAQIDAIFAAA